MAKPFYHFTASERFERIMREGLRIGDVPTSQFGGTNGVWLTTNASPGGHGLGSVGQMTDEEREAVRAWKRVLPAVGTRWLDKTAVRITIEALPDRTKLLRWSRWGRRNCAPGIYDGLLHAGGSKHLSWYIYFGVIPPAYFASVELRGDDHDYHPFGFNSSQPKGDGRHLETIISR